MFLLFTTLVSLLATPSLYSMVVVPGLASIFVLVLWLINLITGKGIKLKLGPINLDLQDRSKNTVLNPVETAKANQRNQTLMVSRLLSFITEKQKLIFRTHTENTERQMNFFDEKVVEIKSAYIEEFAKLLEKRTEKSVDVRNLQEFRTYRMMVDLMLEDIKLKTFKKSIKHNHLADITIDVWEAFIEQKVSVTLAMIKEYFDNNYPDDMSITRKEIDFANERVFDKCRALFTLSYRRARDIAIETRTKIKYIEDEIEREVRNENPHFTRIDVDELERLG